MTQEDKAEERDMTDKEKIKFIKDSLKEINKRLEVLENIVKQIMPDLN